LTQEPTLNQSVCYRHPDRPTGLGCSNCGRPICPACTVSGTVGQFCPECAAARGRQRIIRARPQSGRLREVAPITFAIIAVTVVAYLPRWLSRPLSDQISNLLAQDNSLVAAGEWWRIFTPILVHGPPFHIFFNMWALYQLGPGVEQRLGAPSYLSLYLACAGIGGAFAYYLGGSLDVLVGASGAIFGLFGIWFHAAVRARETAWGRALLGNLGLVLLLNAALPLIYRQISWQGHLGGFLGGLLIAQAWARLPDRSWRPAIPLLLAGLSALVVLL
jgi:membrane associated rhomboid family serine protease